MIPANLPWKRYGRQPLIWLLLLFLPLFFIGGLEPAVSRSGQELWNLGHPFFFMLLVIFGVRLAGRRQATWSVLAVVSLGAIALGGMIELFQALLPGRVASGFDLLADGAGVVLALVWLRWREASLPWQGGLAVVTLMALSWNVLPLGRDLLDESRAREQFPLLSSFESELELARWSGDVQMTRVREPVRQGAFALQVRFTTDTYSGISLQHFPHDWRGWQSLAMAIYNNESNTLPITVRINDQQHGDQGEQLYRDRYNQRFILQPGWNDIIIPLAEVRAGPKGRSMDMGQIRHPGFFVTRQKEAKVVILDNIRLLP